MDASQNVQADPYPEPTGLSIPPIHTKTKVIHTDPYFRITAGRSRPEFWRNLIFPDHRGPIHTRILTEPHI